MIVIFFVLASLPAQAQEPGVNGVAPYAVVLRHVKGEHQLPVLLNAAVYHGLGAERVSPERFHSPAVLDSLHALCVVDAVCRPGVAKETCALPVSGYVYVRLGEIVRLPPETRVKPLPLERTAGARLDELLARVPESEAVPADVAIDVVVTTRCPDPPEAERCRFPDTVSYRYYLRQAGDDHLVVVTRWPIGAI